MKYLLALAAFVITLFFLGSFAFPFFWKVVAGAIVAMGIFFAFDSHHNIGTEMSDTGSNNPPEESIDLSQYLPINEYNKKFGTPTNEIKEKIIAGNLKGTRANGIWYIHSDEIK